MAKGRRLTTSRSERLLGVAVGPTYHYGHVDTDTSATDVSEFGEDDVWSMIEDTPRHHHHHHHPHNQQEWTPRAVERRHVTVTSDRHVMGGLSLAFDQDKTAPSRRIVHQFGTRHVATSAPVSVPDWSKILRVDSSESMHYDSGEDEEERFGYSGSGSAIEPPHEYLARSRKNNAMSVYEGVGRTLKGRDMSRVRDAVWSQTGFEG